MNAHTALFRRVNSRPASYWRGTRVITNPTLFEVIQQVGATSGLKLCLDAGDGNSYDPAIQTDKWLDTSGNSTDFYRGTGTGSDSRDPTFNGSADGKSVNEFWGFDGGDDFTVVGGNPAWVDILHKDNALWSCAAWIRVASLSAASGLLGNIATNANNSGIRIDILTTGRLQFVVFNGGGSAMLTVSNASVIVTVGAWCFVAISINEAAGANGGLLFGNSGTATFNATYSAPSSSAASLSMQIGSRGNNANPLLNGNDLGMLAMWQGAALTADQFDMIYQRTRGRYGV